MRFVTDSDFRRSLLWWLAVLSFAVLLKHHYSVARVDELDWMLRPLTWLLEWSSGHEFYRDGNYEWVSGSANVRLVKACAGINFMLMSFLLYAWLFRPDQRETPDPWWWGLARLRLLAAAVIAAWATSLLANTLRILLAMWVESASRGPGMFGLEEGELHRLIGILIYVPLLFLQMQPGRSSSFRQALTAPILLYLLLMGLVPVLTGNAMQQTDLFFAHLRQIIGWVVAPGLVYLLLSRLRSLILR